MKKMISLKKVEQTHIGAKSGSTNRLMNELKGFKKIHLKPGKKESTDFTISTLHHTSHYTHKESPIDNGNFELKVVDSPYIRV